MAIVTAVGYSRIGFIMTHRRLDNVSWTILYCYNQSVFQSSPSIELLFAIVQLAK
jgi:hypothetical protein